MACRQPTIRRYCPADLDAPVTLWYHCWHAAFAGLPVQPIHGDCHGSNVLLCNGEVSGFIELDHLPTGPRLYDLAYDLADRLKWWIEDAAQCACWLAQRGDAISSRLS